MVNNEVVEIYPNISLEGLKKTTKTYQDTRPRIEPGT
jgi:hypothetical protein